MMDKMGLRLYGYLILAIYLLLIVACPATAVRAEAAEKIVRIGLFEDTYHKINEKGELTGYGYEYLQRIAGYSGWTLEYVNANWYNCFDKLEKGEIDILNGISYTADREKDMLFSTLPMAQERYFIYVDRRNPRISMSDIKSINGKTVGVMEGAVPEKVLNAWEADNQLHTIHTNITTAGDVLSNLAEGNMDCFVSIEEIWDQDYIVPVMYIGSSDVYFAINRNRPDLKQDLDNAMGRIANDDPFYNEKQYIKFFNAPTAAILTDTEKDWLQSHGTIRIGYVSGDTNISKIEASSGKLKGIINDYISFAGDCLGSQHIDFSTKGYDSLEDTIQALQRGEIDMIFKVPYNTHYAAKNKISMSDSTLNVSYTAVTMPGAFDQKVAHTVAVARDEWLQKWYIDYSYPQWKILEYDSVAETVKAVEKGEADCFIVRTGKSRKYVRDSKYQVNILYNEAVTSFGVKREDYVLLSILNKTIKAMPKDMLTDALSVYDGETDNVTMAEYIQDNLPQVMAVTLLICLVFAYILYLLKKARKAEQEADKANATKTDFLRRMSHDIRTPINGIRGMVKIAEHSMDNQAKLQECHDKIWTATEHLLSLVNDVLDMNKLESGKFTLKHEPFDLKQILDEVHVVVEVQAKEHGVDFQHKNTGSIEHRHLLGSPVYLKRIFMNFISNAIKYNKEGGSVHVYGKELSFDGKIAWYEFVCEDTGIGMSREFLARAFEPFSQEEQSEARTKYTGTGLGLAIAASLIKLLRGTIELDSVLGKGTKIVFRLPLEVDKEPRQEKEKIDYSGMRFDGVRVLLVEDNELNAEIATFLLEQHGMAVKWVENGRLAVDELSTHPDAYDVVFMDIMMPVMDGLEAAKAIRKELKQKLPIFAMTANAFIDDVQLSMDAGMNEHLTKPLREKDIIRALLKYIR